MKVLVFGASPNPDRYAHRAVLRLQQYQHEVETFGRRSGEVNGLKLNTELQNFEGIHTVTMYMGATNQVPFYDYLLGLKPQRIIFNPGAENPELAQLAGEQGIEVEEACTLVLLNTGQFE